MSADVGGSCPDRRRRGGPRDRRGLLGAGTRRPERCDSLNARLDSLAAAPLKSRSGSPPLSRHSADRVSTISRTPKRRRPSLPSGIDPPFAVGGTELRGSITKTGNAHLRQVLVEAAWSYRHRPAIGAALRKRSERQASVVPAYAWASQYRLRSRFRSLAARNDRNVVAVARELAGFVWGLMTDRIAVR